VNPRVAFLLILCAVAIVALVLWWLSRHSGVRRRDFTRVRTERDIAIRALHQIEAKADHYRDLDSVLAADIRSIVRDHTNQRMELDR
jgi:hypothetical protein